MSYIALQKREAKMQTLWNQYLRETRTLGYFELKITDERYLPLSRIEKHQYEGLQAMEESGFVWKLSDEDTRQKPCDCFCAPPMTSYVVIKFPGEYCYMVPFKEIVKLREDGLISIKQEKAQEVAEKIVKLST